MAKPRVLIADNDQGYASSLQELLEREGYAVDVALNVAEAAGYLDSGQVDLAILDIRLARDADERDLSGLQLAKQFAPDVPKMIMTGYGSEYIRDNVIDALLPGPAGPSTIVQFVDKREGVDALLRAVEMALLRGAALSRLGGASTGRAVFRPVYAPALISAITVLGIIAIATGNPWWLLGALLFAIVYAAYILRSQA